MTTQDNKDISRRFLEELWNQKNKSIIDELIADTYVDHTPPPLQGAEALKELFDTLQQDLADIHVTIEDQIAEDDKVMTRVTWECTLKSDHASPASIVTVMGVGVDRIDGGKIAESWNILDILYRILKLIETHIAAPLVLPCDDNDPCPFGYACQFGVCNRV